MRRHQQKGLTYFQAGLITLVLVVAGTYLGFSKSIPFRSHFEIKAVFKTSNNLRPNSPVRVAGVNVGKVTAVEHTGAGEQATVVTMRIQKKGMPIHKDAEMTIRPRIFLEGNFFVDVRPGSPSAPTLGDGDTLPINQTRSPVQLDQLLTALQSDTREDLKRFLTEYAKGLEGEGGKGYNRSIPYWEPAYKGSAIVNDATLGLLEHDLSGYVEQAGTVAGALDRNREQLKSLITDFNATAAAFASESGNLERAIAELPRTLRAAQPALAALNESFPPLRRLIADFRPAVRSSGPTIDASLPFVKQARRLVAKSELRGLVADLRPVVPSLTRLNSRSIPLYQQVRAASSCQNEVILPWSHDKIQDETFPAQGKVYEESVRFLPGIAGESRSGDANGQWFRTLATNGPFYYQLDDGVYASTANPIIGTNPPKPASRPPIEPNVPCETQQTPDLRTVPGPGPQRIHQDTTSAAYKARYARARARAIKWLRRQLEVEGLDKTLRVSEKDVTRSTIAQLKALKERLAK